MNYIPPAVREFADRVQECSRPGDAACPDYLSDEERRAVDSLTEQGYEKLDQGTDRIVVGLSDEWVVKVARPMQGPYGGRLTNRDEWGVWREATSRQKKYIAPFGTLAQEGLAITVRRAPRLIGRAAEVPRGFLKTLEQRGIEVTDTLIWNLGYVPDRDHPVLIDLGGVTLT